MMTLTHKEKEVTTRTLTETEPPKWLLAFWREIDDKTFGKGFDCVTTVGAPQSITAQELRIECMFAFEPESK